MVSYGSRVGLTEPLPVFGYEIEKSLCRVSICALVCFIEHSGRHFSTYADYVDGRSRMTFKLSPRALDRDLVFDFFWKFSAFECALKREGFLRAGRKNAAEPDWDCFGREIQGRFARVSDPGFKEAVKELVRLSPRRQVVRDGELQWDIVVRSEGESDEAFTLRLLKTARNNLFHGGKYPDGPIDEIARDRNVLRAALVILEGCYEIHAGVKRWVDEAA